MAMAGSIVNAVGTFTDEDIIKIAPEVANPVLDGWEFFVESTGVQIHRKYREVSGQGGNYLLDIRYCTCSKPIRPSF